METGQGEQARGTVYCAHGHACWAVALILALTAVVATIMPRIPMPGVRTTLGIIAFTLVTVAALLVVAEIKTNIRVEPRGLTIRQWPDLDRFVSWDRVVAMHWRHAWWGAIARRLRLCCQPGAHGFVELDITDGEGRVRHDTITNYVCLGKPPASVLSMIEDIAARAGLARDDQRPEPWYPHMEEANWDRAHI